MSNDTSEKLDRLKSLVEIVKEGYGGILPTGQIVDRRQYPSAYSVPKNTLFGCPDPKEIETVANPIDETL